MSIVCAAIKHGEVSISADTLMSCGALTASSTHRENSSKLYPVNGSVIGLVGWCAISTVLEHLIQQDGKLFRFDNRMEILASLLKLHQKMKRDYFLESREDRDQPVESTQLHALIVNAHGLFEACSYRSVSEYKTFWAIGSGRRLALGAMHASYTAKKSARAIAEAGVRAAAEFDDACGLPLTSEVIGLGT
ncbi:MAG TPA: MFS transporter [Gammaproteobacteria bacterium]|nr:MFS transporter [Gammaproteobacteria bacterium]